MDDKSVAEQTDLRLGKAGAPTADVLPREEHRAALEIPLWKIRLELAWKGFKGNAALFAENKIGLIGLGIILFFALMAVAYPILINTVWDPNTYDPIVGYDYEAVQQPAPPSVKHLLGTDPLGRDVLSQLLYSTSSEFALGVVAAIVTVVIATTIGAVSAYYGGGWGILLRVEEGRGGKEGRTSWAPGQ